MEASLPPAGPPASPLRVSKRVSKRPEWCQPYEAIFLFVPAGKSFIQLS